MAYIIFVAVLYVASIATAIYSFTQNKFRKDFDSDKDVQKLKALGVQRLVLKRYRFNNYMGSARRTKKEISLDAAYNDKSGPFNSVEEELQLYGIKGKKEHLVCSLPYCEENKKKMLKIMEEYNA